MLLHVVDASGTEPQRQIDAVNTVLKDIGAVEKPTIIVLNKIDLVDEETLTNLRARFPDAILCSAATGSGIDGVLAAIDRELARHQGRSNRRHPVRSWRTRRPHPRSRVT